jgi:indole-3-glycerol phosphate synthase / phosphoribosylanthranilate isomerase
VTGGVLDRIVARTRRDVAVRAERIPRAALEDRIEGTPRDFRGALAAPGLGLIAEFKPRSPSRGDLRPDAVPEEFAAAYRPYAAAISVLCDEPFFGGSREALGRIRAASGLPVLCKDFLVTPYQLIEARAAGADAVLLMVVLLDDAELRELRALARSLGMATLVEVHDATERARALDAGADIVGVNSRDLRTLDVDLARIEELADGLPAGVVRIGESGLHDRDDVARVAPLVDAVLIGTALMTSPDPAAAIEALGFAPCR